MTSTPRIAIAHDYLTQQGGAERVVLALAKAFPDAPIHTTFYWPEGTYPEFRDRDIVTSPLNRVGVLRRDPRKALPLLARACTRMQIDADLVVASSSGWAHGFTTDARRLIYCHAPARWLYQTDSYVGEEKYVPVKRIAATVLRPGLIRWDQAAAARADRYLANSHVVRDRIQETYGIEADVLAPPFGISADGDQDPVAALEDWDDDEGYVLVVSRLLPYKNVDRVIDAVRGTRHRLVVVGAGPERERLVAMAPENVRLLSGLSDGELRWVYGHAHLLVGPSYEDFGLTPLEANSFGMPVAAFRAGGYLDTVAEGVSGLHFEEPEADLIRTAIEEARGRVWDRDAIRAHADSFSEERFIARIRAEADALLSAR